MSVAVVLLLVEAVVLLPVEAVVLLSVEEVACSSSVSMFWRSVAVAVPFATLSRKLLMSEEVVSLSIIGGAIPEELSCTVSRSELLSVEPKIVPKSSEPVSSWDELWAADEVQAL